MDDVYAYMLSQTEAGWRWSIYDQMGERVASGLEADQGRAQAAARAATRRLMAFEPTGHATGAQARLQARGA